MSDEIKNSINNINSNLSDAIKKLENGGSTSGSLADDIKKYLDSTIPPKDNK